MKSLMNYPWPIVDYAKWCCGKDGNGKLLMLVAYFDESGVHGEESEVTTVAGFIGDTLEWADLEIPWKKAINPLQAFHACDNQGRKDNLFVDLAKLIAERKLFPIAGSVRRDDWNYCCKESEIQKHIPSRYHAALMMAFIQAKNFVKTHCPEEYLAFVFATNEQYDEYVKVVYEALRQDNDNGGKIGSIGFCRPQLLIPLQAADLYCNETYHEIVAQNDGTSSPKPIRPALEVFNKIIGMESLIATPEMLYGMANEFSDKSLEIIQKS